MFFTLSDYALAEEKGKDVDETEKDDDDTKSGENGIL